MRANAWHIRVPHSEHFQWYRNLVELHDLTNRWLAEIHSDRQPHLLTRGLSPEISENLWILESMSKINLEQLADDTSLEDMLYRLEHTIWAVQAWTLNAVIGRSTQTTKEVLDTLLEQISWKAGKACVESRWKKLANQNQTDIRKILLCLKDSPFSGYPQVDGFLTRRAVETEVHLELRYCPHQIHYPEVKPAADRLCRLHTEWMRGFTYELNSHVAVEHVIQKPRCTQRWYFI